MVGEGEGRGAAEEERDEQEEPREEVRTKTSSSSSWWSLGLEDDIICASYLWVREWLCRPILDLQSRVQSGHWKFAFVAKG